MKRRGNTLKMHFLSEDSLGMFMFEIGQLTGFIIYCFSDDSAEI